MLTSRSIRRAGLIVLGLLAFKLFFDWWTYERPEYGPVIAFMKQNPDITDLYGVIQSYVPDDFGSDVEWRGNGLSLSNGKYLGTSKFNIVGSKHSGTVTIFWVSDSNHQIIFTEITSAPEGEAQRTLWTAK